PLSVFFYLLPSPLSLTSHLVPYTTLFRSLLEQSMAYVKKNSFGLFLVPSNFLETDQSDQLKKWLSGEEIFLQGIIQLPTELFKNEATQKSILLLQRQGEKAKQVPQVLLAKLETLKDPKAVVAFFNEFKQWQKESGLI